MLKIKNVTIKNFMSVGNVTETINLDGNDVILVVGENIDQGGLDVRNGCGKCVSKDAVIKIKNTITGEILETTIGKFYEACLDKP